MKHSSVLFAGSLLFLGIVSASAQKAPPSLWEGLFTEAQVQRGQAAYTSDCASCHGANLNSRDKDGSALSGQDFDFAWREHAVSELFERVRKTMPPRAEGKLGDQVYVDIVAFILQYNGYPTGDQELKSDVEILKKIVIESQSRGGSPVS